MPYRWYWSRGRCDVEKSTVQEFDLNGALDRLAVRICREIRSKHRRERAIKEFRAHLEDAAEEIMRQGNTPAARFVLCYCTTFTRKFQYIASIFYANFVKSFDLSVNKDIFAVFNRELQVGIVFHQLVRIAL